MPHNRITIHHLATIALSDDKKRVALHSAEAYQRNLEQFKVGEKVSVTIDNERVTASEQQRRYLFGVCYPIIGDYCGYEKDEVHDALMRQHFGTRKIKIFGQEKEVRKSWTTLSKAEGVEYIDWLIRMSASELGCHIPSPEEAGYISNTKKPV